MLQLRRAIAAKKKTLKRRTGELEWMQKIDKDEREERELSQALDEKRVVLQDKHERLREAQVEFDRAQQSYEDTAGNLQIVAKRLEISK